MGIKLKRKDPRDYFLGEIVSKTDPITSMHIMQHSSLAITNLYKGKRINEKQGLVRRFFCPGKCVAEVTCWKAK